MWIGRVVPCSKIIYLINLEPESYTMDFANKL